MSFEVPPNPLLISLPESRDTSLMVELNNEELVGLDQNTLSDLPQSTMSLPHSPETEGGLPQPKNAIEANNDNLTDIQVHTSKNLGDLPKIVLVLGGPGSGKGTQCASIVQKYGYIHISTGDLLRQEIEAQTEIGTSIKEDMQNGKMVPIVTAFFKSRRS